MSESEDRRRKQLETDRSSGDGRPPSITTVGVGDDGDDDESETYVAGESYECVVVGSRLGGYEVFVPNKGKYAFLKTSKLHSTGERILACFSHWQNKA